MCGARGQRNGKTRTSLFTTTVPRLTGPLKFRSFWPRTTWQWSPSPILTRSGPLWLFPLPQTEASDEGSKIRHRFKRNRSGYLTQFQKGTSRDASKHGRNAGTAVFVRKGNTSKVMEELTSKVNKHLFTSNVPNFWIHPCIRKERNLNVTIIEESHSLILHIRS